MNNGDKIVKKSNYCINCNTYGHVQKKCEIPTISNGIISFYIKNLNEQNKKELEKYLCEKINKNEIIDDININENELNENIKILMIQRKHSLGYVEFIRGCYNEKKINNNDTNDNSFPSINHLIEQMNSVEICDILYKEFDDLWNKLWNSNSNKYYNEYMVSRKKFYEIRKNFDMIEFKKSKYGFNEWGFPKGRRNQYETDLVCALREFEEETNINEKDIMVFEKCNFIRERMTGTNDIQYVHNYFFALLDSEYVIKKENMEVGDIKIMNVFECLEVIRPYHFEKIKIIKFIYSLIKDFLDKIV
jgi:8-oxo-dGTP pyrophosphatase MutT (NUDIX family)